jgi:hypothetical protein
MKNRKNLLIFMKVILLLLLLGSISLFFNSVRELIITVIEKIVLQRSLVTHDKTHRMLMYASFIGIFFSCIMFPVILLIKIRLNKSLKYLIIFLIFLFAPMVLLIHYPINNELIVDSEDGIASFMNISLITRALSEGEFPVWNKYVLNGMPTIGNSSLINVPALILGWLPLQWLVLFLYCLHISCAAFFMYLYLKEIKCDTPAAFAVALILLFSIHFGGMRKSHFWVICAVSYFPALMFFIQRHLNTEKIKYLAFASGILAFAFSYTQTQLVVYMATASGIYLIFVCIKNHVKFDALIKRIAVFSLLFFIFSAVTLFPMVELINEYRKNGAGDVPYDFFISGSITLVNLIYMLFPRFFGGNELFFSSNIEFFIGVTALVIVLYSIKSYLRHNFQMILSLGMCLIAFIYMSIGFIPILRDIVYHMPVFGGFRAPFRMLFVFLFFLYSIIGLSLTKLRHGDMTPFFKFQRRFTAVIFIFICALSVILIAVFNIIGEHEHGADMGSISDFVKNALLPTFLVLFCVALLFWFIDTFSKKYSSFFNEQRQYYAMIAVVCIFTLSETIPFLKMTYSTPIVKAEEDELTSTLYANIKNGKIFDAYAGVSAGGHQSLISQNKSVAKSLPSINAYIPFNNPILYRFISGVQRAPFNSSGILIGSYNAGINVMYQNDFLSMMGVKYIIDSSELLSDEGTESFNANTNTHIPIIEGLSFDLAHTNKNPQTYSELISIKPDSYYFVVLDYYVVPNKKALLLVDLYDTISDSLNHVQKQLSPNSKHAELLFYSGDSKAFLGEQYLRVFSFYTGKESVKVSQLSLYEVENEETSNLAYIPFYNDGQNRIFENVNAQDILYFSEAVKGINDTEYLFERSYNLKLDKISYILNAQDRTFDLQGSSIKDINFKYNSITGIVESVNGNFINFSQNYFPGWRVYIDGKRAELKQVNALIMGVYVPPGIHTVKFAFVSISFILGLITTCSGVIACVVLFGLFPYLRQKKTHCR